MDVKAIKPFSFAQSLDHDGEKGERVGGLVHYAADSATTAAAAYSGLK